MSSEANPVADWVSESAYPTVNALIFHLRSSFFPQEFDFVAKTLTDREDQLVSENVKLSDELKVKESEIDGVMKLSADVMAEFGVYEKQVLEILKLRKMGEEENGLLVSKNLKLNDELKTKLSEIETVKKMNSEYERQIGVYEKRSADDLKNLKLNEELKMKVNEIDLVVKANAEYEIKIGDYEKRVSEFLEFKRKAEEEKELLVSKNLELLDELKSRGNEIDAAMKANDEHEREFRGYEKRSLDELELRIKAEEEKDLLVLKNRKLIDELKTKQNVIDALMKVNAEFEEKSRAYEKRSMDDLELKKKTEEEKELLVSENLKLVDELKMKQNEIDAVMKVIAEHGSKTRVYKNRSLESDAKVFGSEKLAIESVGSGKEKKDCASESDRKQLLVSVKKDSKRKTEVKLPEIIDIDDDDLEFVPTNKRRQVLNEKTELRYVSRLYSTCRNK